MLLTFLYVSLDRLPAMSPSVKIQGKNAMMLGTVTPSPANAGLNLDNKG
jgi:hypothetical protein